METLARLGPDSELGGGCGCWKDPAARMNSWLLHEMETLKDLNQQVKV